MCYIGLDEVAAVCTMKAYGGFELLLNSFFNPPTRYGLDVPGIESRWGRDFPHPSRATVGAHPASCTIGTGFFPGVKAAGAWRWPPIPFSAEIKERVELYLYPPLGLHGLFWGNFTNINLGTTWKWIIRFTPRPVYRREKREWYQLKRKLRGRRNEIRCLYWESNHNASVLRPVTSALPITLSGQCYNGLVV